jgi:glycosyltransferase involved in cell wall biosynthesis
MGLRRIEVELSEPAPAVQLGPQETGVGVIARWRGRLAGFAIVPFPAGARIDGAAMAALMEARLAGAVLKHRARAELEARTPPADPGPPPRLSIAICTRDRPARLARLLDSVAAVRGDVPFAGLEVLVVDNAPSDDATRHEAERRSWVRYVLEPKAGLDFARNAALRAAGGDLIAYLDDDVVVDRGWLQGLYDAWRSAPDAGGYTGLVLPYRLETEAQAAFEARGGFGRGFEPAEFRERRYGNRLHPVGAGILGAGCNMCFDRQLLLALGGFDEALDTGAPLPGGGDLDIFYRVLRRGRPVLYEPAYAVCHEHRETLPQLERQYWTWGLGFMAFLVKSRQTDPELAPRHAAMVWWWLCDRGAAVARAVLHRRWRDLAFAWAELRGGIQGLSGEYRRSQRRSQAIRERAA